MSLALAASIPCLCPSPPLALQLGGFKEWPLLEDVDLVSRLKRDVSPPAILPLDMYTSGR